MDRTNFFVLKTAANGDSLWSNDYGGECYITLCPRKDYNYIDQIGVKSVWIYPAGADCIKELSYDLLCKDCINLYTEKYSGELKFEMIKIKLGIK